MTDRDIVTIAGWTILCLAFITASLIGAAIIRRSK